MTSTLFAAGEPAGGAEIAQVIIATAGAGVATAVVAFLIFGHRAGRFPFLTRVADYSARVSGLPGWAALPSAVAGVSLMTALLGMYWDISLHIDDGRDAGPLANPAHYLILAGLYGVFTSGVLAMALPRNGERPGPSSVRITRDWHVPVGGLLIASAGAFALIGFPLDDMWHRLFGQDVTLWGPTHLMLIGGAAMTLVGQSVLLAEGVQQRRQDRPVKRTRGTNLVTASRRVALMGGFLIGLSTFQAEFDFGVPQYQMIFHPFLIALAAGMALVAGRLWVGPGGAIGAAVFFLVVRGIVGAFVGPVFGQTTPTMPLYLPEAIVVELAALALARRPLALGAVAGALIGTIGFLGEYAWTQVAFPLPWTEALIPGGFVWALIGGIGGGMVGALYAEGLRGRLPDVQIARTVPVVALLAFGGVLVNGLITEEPAGARATIAMLPGDQAEIRVTPASLTEKAHWVTVTAWQGSGRHVDRLERVSEGVFRTTKAIPLDQEWKALLRIQTGRAVIGAPIRLPEDSVIPAPEVPAPAVGAAPVSRELVRDTKILQRERKEGTSGWLWATAGGVVLALFLAFFGAIGWGIGRVGRGSRPEPPARREPPAPVEPPERLPAGVA